MPWAKGQSGNPTGRKPGTGKVDRLRKKLEAHVPEVLDALVAKAKEGDTAASKLLLDRVLPTLKPIEQTVSVPMGETFSESGQTVLQAVGAGQIPPSQATQLLQAIGMLARVTEVEELARRLEDLEGKVNGKHPTPA